MYAKIKIEIGDKTLVRNGKDIAAALRNLADKFDQDPVLYVGKRFDVDDEFHDTIGLAKIKE